MTPVDIETRLRRSLEEVTQTTPLTHPSGPRPTHGAETASLLWPPATGTRNPVAPATGPAARRRVRLVVGLAAVLVLVAGFGLALAYGPHDGGPGVNRPASGVGQGTTRPTGPADRTFPLPSDGWKPGDPSLLALTGGTFHAVLTTDGACAWLGPDRRPFQWPAGYQVRFHPTELIDGSGHVVATEGQTVYFGGGERPAPAGTPCATTNETTWYVQSRPVTPGPSGSG